LQLVICQMEEDDLEQVIHIEKESFRCPWSLSSFQSEMRVNKYSYYIVAKKKADNLVVGYTGTWILFEEAHITTLAVHPDFRQKGIAAILLEHLLSKFRNVGVTYIFLEVRSSNYSAQKLYEKYSFAIAGKRKRYYDDEDAIIMVKHF